MSNEIKVIDGVRGKWRTVTKPSEVDGATDIRVSDFKGQWTHSCKIPCKITMEHMRWKYIQAFFPLTVKIKSKVAKVTVMTNSDRGYWWDIQLTNCIVSGNVVESRKSAIRGARRFCKAIGYECEILKG